MRKVLQVAATTFLCMLLVTACTDKKPVTDTNGPQVQAVDTVPEVAEAGDTIAEIISEEPIPKAADELFDDFLYLFCQSRKHQVSRVKFPLPVTEGETTSHLTKGCWRMEHLYVPQGYYTLILDSRKELRLSQDTTVSHVVVEKIFLEQETVDKFCFDRVDGIWMLTSVEHQAPYKEANASFLQFYQKFATDSVFQTRSLNETVAFSGPAPDDESEETISGEITPEQWPDFSPGDLPQDVIWNIDYGQKYQESNKKIFLLRGIANGQEMEMTFQRKGNDWKLTGLVE